MSLPSGGCSLVPSSSSSDLSATVPRKLRSDRVPGLDLSTLQGVVSGSLPFESLLSLVVCTALDDGQDRSDDGSDDRVLRLLYVLQRGSSVSPLDAPVTKTITEPNNQSSFDTSEDPYSKCSLDNEWRLIKGCYSLLLRDIWWNSESIFGQKWRRAIRRGAKIYVPSANIRIGTDAFVVNGYLEDNYRVLRKCSTSL